MSENKNYLQINIGGKERGLKILKGTLILMQEVTGLGTTAYTAYALIYAGLKTNAFTKEFEFADEIEEDGKKKEMPITFEMVCDWVDELPENILIEVMNFFKETNAYKQMLLVSEK